MKNYIGISRDHSGSMNLLSDAAAKDYNSIIADVKKAAIRDRKTGEVYSGIQARDLLGIPHSGTVKLNPGSSTKFDVFVQSTSVNRKLVPGTQVMYWVM